jgi:hypothetical protein
VKVKHKVKAKFGLLRKTARRVNVKIDRVSEEVLPMLFGMQALWNVSPQNYINNLKDKDAILNILRLSGYIKGPNEGWIFSNALYESAATHLLKCPAFARKCHSVASQKALPSLMEIVKHFRRNLKQYLKDVPHGVPQRVASTMRILCKRNDINFLKGSIDPFFEAAAQTDHDYSIQSFERFLKTRLQLGLQDHGW